MTEYHGSYEELNDILTQNEEHEVQGEENVKINEHNVKGVINFKMTIEGKKLPKNSPSVPFHSEESIIKWNFGYYGRLALDKLYVERPKYNEIVELPSDAQLLKTILNIGACYPKLMKEFVVRNDRIPHGLLNFSYNLFVEKDILDISLPNVSVIDKSGLFYDKDMSKVAYMFRMVKSRKEHIHEA